MDENIFKDSKKLKRINFSSNKIHSFPIRLLQGQKDLEEVWLSNNQITVLNDNIFIDCKKLKIINFGDSNGGNLIEKLPKNLFFGLTLLEIVYFGNNQITELDENLFKDSKKLKKISFQVDFYKVKKILQGQNLF